MTDKVTTIKNQQVTIDKLLDEGSLALHNGITNKWSLEPLYQEKDCSIGFVRVPNVELGPCTEHIHPNAQEYLIVVRGSILLNINGVDVRVAKAGDCASIPENCLHKSRPLENNTKLIYVCIPADPNLPDTKEGGTNND